MNISFKGIYCYKYSNSSVRNAVKELENQSNNGNGKFWTSVKIDKDKKSSDLLVVCGLDLEEAYEKAAAKKISVRDYIKANADSYIEKAKICDYTI